MKERLVYVDLVRAYSIFLVTSFHIWRFFSEPTLEFFKYYDFYLIFKKGDWGVILFFIISGFSMALITHDKISTSTINWKNYFIKRLYRIVPAYYFAILIWTILILNGIAPKPISFFDQITHLLFIHTLFPSTFYSISGVFWTLGIEMQFYLILPFIVAFIIKYPLITISITILPILFSIFSKFNFPINSAFIFCLFYFILGYLIFIYKNQIYRLFFDNRYKKIIFITFIIIFLHFTFIKESLINIQLNKLLWVIFFLPIFIYMSENKLIQESKNKFLSFIVYTGTASYSIYLYNYIYYITPKPIIQNFYAPVFYFIFVYLIGILMYLIIEKPIQKIKQKFIKSF
jgi:peptidoglycan/LPS O-acetylase OafA/YrhL